MSENQVLNGYLQRSLKNLKENQMKLEYNNKKNQN